MGFSLGGFGAGIAQGAEDWRRADEEKRRKEDHAFMQEQRQRMQREQAESDQLREKLKGIKTTKTESYGGDDMMPATTRETPRSMEEIYRDEAAIYTGAGRADLAAQSRDRAEVARRGVFQDQMVQAQLAQIQRQAANQARADQNFKIFRDALGGDQDALNKMINSGLSVYNQNPRGTDFADGYTGRFDPDSRTLHFTNQQGFGFSRPINQLTPQEQQQYLSQGLKAMMLGVSPEYYAQFKDLDFKELQALATQQQGQAALQNAAANTTNAGTQSRLATAQIDTGGWGQVGRNEASAALDRERIRTGNFGETDKNSAQANWYNARDTSAPGSGAANRPMKVDVPIVDPATGKTNKVPIIVHRGANNEIVAKYPDGRPFTDTAAIDRAFGNMDALGRIDAEAQRDLTVEYERYKSGASTPEDFQAAKQRVAAWRQTRIAQHEFSGYTPEERAEAVTSMLKSGRRPEAIIATFGVTADEIKAAKKQIQAGGKQGITPPTPSTPTAPPQPVSMGISPERVRDAAKSHGVLGAAEAVLGPRPSPRNPEARARWDRQAEAIQSMLTTGQ